VNYVKALHHCRGTDLTVLKNIRRPLFFIFVRSEVVYSPCVTELLSGLLSRFVFSYYAITAKYC